MATQKDILCLLYDKNDWLNIKEIMICMDLEYNGTNRCAIQRKLLQLEKFDFIFCKTEKLNTKKGWGCKLFKAKRCNLTWMKIKK